MDAAVIERRLIELSGLVQGVGMRPHVYRLAARHALRGTIRNGRAGVLIDVEGDPSALTEFMASVAAGPPPLAAIAATTVQSAAPRFYRELRIAASDTAGEDSMVPPADTATCAACLAELRDPADRRFGYPFIACSDCGPRLTVMQGVPYDRARTSMAGFVPCSACLAEYEAPDQRRFHAQNVACWECGPTPRLLTEDVHVAGRDAVAAAIGLLIRGRIVAIKGLGGFHLACDAADVTAVQRLRRRKARDTKPLAIMARDLAHARDLAQVDEAEARLLTAPERPIVLVRARAATTIAPDVAPGRAELGIMLPYTPLHQLLLDGAARALVMTSANHAGAPMISDDAEALAMLRGVADGWLINDRPIAHRCDDSVARVVSGAPQLLRRSRGYVPVPLRLPRPVTRPVLAMGGHLKNAFCFASGDRAVLSPHIGDLEDADTYLALRTSLDRYQGLLAQAPDVVAHDEHPDYLSTRLAEELFPLERRVAVQHHHAHVAACLADNGLAQPVIGIALDGAGLGPDGAVWGGEFLVVDGRNLRRAGHLRYVALPGGDAAARAPDRMAISYLWSAFGPEVEALPLPLLRAHRDTWPALREVLARKVHCPPTSSMGRLFDAVAAIADVGHRNAYDGEAASRLEALATTDAPPYAFDVTRNDGVWLIDALPVIRDVAADTIAGRAVRDIASAFHAGVADMLVNVAAEISRATAIGHVALTGGVFQNRRLLVDTAARLQRRGLTALMHRHVPCNDGGLALGQAVLAGGTN